MRKSNYLVLALALLATALGATAQKTAYGYTMMPCTTPSMISFTVDDPSSVTRLGTYTKAEPRSGAVVGSTLYMMGIDDDFNMWFYSITPDGSGETIKKLGDATCPGDLTYDYTTSTMYFIANSEDVDGVSAIGTVNMENGKMTFTSNLPYYCKALAVDARGQMYALTNSGQLLKVNKSNGETQVIGQTGVTLASWWNFQSMEFDRATGTLYLAAWGSDEKSTLYTIDTTTGQATKVGAIGDGTHAIALGIPYEPSSGSAPDHVTEVTLTADDSGALEAILTWLNPSTDYSGSPLEGTISIEIVNTVTGEKAVLEDCQPGEAMRHAVTVSEAGMYEFTITAVNASGASLEQPVEGWIGHDVPGAVGNAQASLSRTQLLVNDLTWTAPIAGAHGGYLDKGSLRYDVVRLNDGKTIAEDITTTRLSDTKLIDELTRYSYQIVAKNADGNGEPAKTNDLVNGPAVQCPYVAPFNSWEESGQYWTVLDGNEDGYPFVWYKDFMNMFGQGGDKCFYIYQKNETFYAYDFIISPPIEFREGHEYKITANVSNDDIAGYREEQFRFYTFSGYDLNGAVPLGNEAFTVKHPGEFRDYSFTFKVEDDGYGSDDETFPSFIALCCCSHYDMGMLLVNSISIEDLTAAATPPPGDLNEDGEINIADVNFLIAMILSGNTKPIGDVNGDGEINIADVNILIDIVLNH
jgi:hypothetical protein